MSTARISVAELGVVAETLLIPLAARALAPTLNPDLNFHDPIAEATLARLDTDPSRFAGDRASMRGSVVRAIWFDRVAKKFLESHPNALCVSMGSGLDARAQRLGLARHPSASWLDLDSADVVSLRGRLLEAVPNASDRVAELGDDRWMTTLPWITHQPAMFLAEGVMMYLAPASVERFVRTLSESADNRDARIDLAFDYSSPWMVRNSRRHPSVRKTKAEFSWALARPSDLQAIDPKLVVAEHQDITAASGLIPALMGHIHRLVTGREIYACVRYERSAA